MATPGEKLAESLEVLKKFQDNGIVAIKTTELSRVHRERLLENKFLKEVMKGWYMMVPANEKDGDTTSWYASYWNFCAGYLADRYGDGYCISAEQSLLIHAGNWTVPLQLIVRSVDGPNGITPLAHDTSLFTMKSPLPNSAEIEKIEGIRMLSLPSSLIHCSPTMFIKNPTDVRTALTMIRDASEILGLLLDGGHSTVAGRLAGAFRNIGEAKIADEIIKTMAAVGYDVRESDPFETKTPIALSSREKSPYVNRIKLMWYDMRQVIIKYMPKAPGLPKDHEKYMRFVEEIYVTDAYHSLSIERYRVTPELIERVRTGAWNIDENEEDRKQKDAMAARGYWQATQKVKESIKRILNGEDAGKVADSDHGDWYRELFGPSVTAGIIKASDLAGYRNNQVYIGGSKHVPLNRDAVRDAMPVLFELLRGETEPFVKAVLGHFIYVYIHPYVDGNGRTGRFLMNVMLASGGYPWTVIPVQERETYMKALEKASVSNDMEGFAQFIATLVDQSMQGTPVAAVVTKPEFPPYKFYKYLTETKYETWTIPVDDTYSILRLFNVSLSPMTAKHALSLEIVVDNGAERKSTHYNLSNLFYNPNLPNHLFFVTSNSKHTDIILPKGSKRLTLKINLLSQVEMFDLQLACEYIK